MSDMKIGRTIKNGRLGQYTPHGRRSTFSDCANGEGRNHRWVEDFLAHSIVCNIEPAYHRVTSLSIGVILRSRGMII
ncbi:MAG: hypothetical protein P8H90_09085 [Tateyamaria sp.]|nr:hypothetical protein [Tateyamaria sp.]MDG1420121.1 hypothetical protein [Tateyamaria sp.]MDG1679295.1 hypothetical protein [Tateyamaria sp.]